MLDGLDAFVAAYAERDGGRLIDEIENLVREGAAVGVITVLATDRTGFTHRLASAIGARLVLRQSDTADFALFGVERKSIPGSMSAGRAVWAATGEEVQIAVLCADPSGQAQNEAVARLAAEVGQFADSAVLPKRVDSLPVEITLDEAEMLRLGVRQSGCCTIAVGGARLGPVDVDLADAGTFLICGPSRSGRSTALVALVQSLVRQGGTEVVLICPRPSPLRELAREVGVRAVYGDGCSEDLTALADEDVVVVVDDAELINDQRTIAALERLARGSRDGGPPLVAAATTDDVLLSRFRGWLAEMRRSRSGLLLRPTSSVDGEAFELRLPRSIGNGWPAGRALLVERGSHQEVQVVVAHSPGSAKL
jgi:S-DNA-T family DNA segregation ATPase FtsK/SpoIIIE